MTERQASIACSLAADGAAACWSRLSADALLAQLASPAQPGAIIPDGVLALLADPAAHILVPTVETFLDCAGEVQRAARELRVHRTTLYYRLGRAEQISGLNLRDGRDRLCCTWCSGCAECTGRLEYRACPPPLPPVFLQMPGTGPATCNAALDDFRSAR